ncbi:hypothetical protein [Paraburkholderia sp. 40]|uniref:hypothetical protein n=1 Tax=Paraburkholderia sp. 40 TaxID=2991059 RepID=UPI003D250EBE
MRRLLLLVGLLVTFVSGGSATAADSGPYLVGHWKLADTFTESKVPPVVTDNTEFVFLNPTPLTLTLEYAFFDSAGTFCGCDRDTLAPNGRTRYTMLAELNGGQFSQALCPSKTNQTDGVMKTIVFTKADGGDVDVGDAVEAGYQIDLFNGGRTESDLKAVLLNPHTKAEINSIHKQCNTFITSTSSSKKK